MIDSFGPIQWFDRNAICRHQGINLPHYEMPGAVYFITFRLWDSLPADVYDELASARAGFLQHNPPPRSEEQELQLKQIYYTPLERYLDKGLGRCVLRFPEARQVLVDALLRLDGDRYQLGEYVIMPNHVHLLMRVRPGASIRGQCRSWKNFSARRINHLTECSGHLWQPDTFDHIIRSPAKLQQFREYIQNNPRRLPSSDFTLGQGTLFQT